MSIFQSIKNALPRKTTSGWVGKTDIDMAGLGVDCSVTQDSPTPSGVVLGINPYTHKLMLDNQAGNVALVAPTRSGKGVNTVIPTCLIWHKSLFVFDPMGEVFATTGGYRKRYLKQKVVRIMPDCRDGECACWNPLAEIRFQTSDEWDDAFSIAETLLRFDSPEADASSVHDAAVILAGVFLHFLYTYHLNGNAIPSMFDVSEFFQSADTPALFEDIKESRHISHSELFKKNLFHNLYGDYLPPLQVFRDALGNETFTSMEDILQDLLEKERLENDVYPPRYSEMPCAILFQHPKVLHAADLFNSKDAASKDAILQMIRHALACFRDIDVRKNTERSEVSARDLLDAKQAISVYFFLGARGFHLAQPIAQLFVSLLHRAIMEAPDSTQTSPQLLLMLDEFPWLGKLPYVQEFLSVCTKKSVKTCIVIQSIGQTSKLYGKENTILESCRTQVYFTPTLEDGGGTAKFLAEKLTETQSHDPMEPTARLMDADELVHMSSEKGIVLVQGQKPIYADKFRYYKSKFLNRRTQVYEYPKSDTRVVTWFSVCRM